MLKKIIGFKISLVLSIAITFAITTIREGKVENYYLKEQVKIYKEVSEKVTGMDFGNLKVATVDVTSYNPVKRQCDSTPLQTSEDKLVTPGILAVSQDLQKRYGIRMGDKVMLEGYGLFTVGDYMNKRFKNRVDIISFIPGWSAKFGVKPKVKLYFNCRK